MKREIKFRAWDNEKSQMIWGNNGLYMFLGSGLIGWNFGYEYNDIGSYTMQDKYILMQYTGLKDKNGKEIYEGDIVKWKTAEQKTPDDYFDELGYVNYFDGGFLAGSNNLTRWNTDQGLLVINRYRFPGSIVSGDLFYQNWDIEIIGNIYENPELI